MKKVPRRLFLLILLCCSLCVPTYSWSEVLFQDNFDTQIDWQPRPGINDVSPSGAVASCSSGDCTGQLPTGWSFYRASGLWWGPSYEDSIRVNGDNHRGATGKAFTMWHEANPDSSGGGWGADGQITKYFKTDYNELYLQAWVMGSPDFIWGPTSNTRVSAKLFRIGHYDGSGSVYLFGSGGPTAPLYFFDWTDSVYAWTDWAHTHSFRCDPQSSYYLSCPGGSEETVKFTGSTEPNAPGQTFDGEWHSYTIRVKMNTYNSGTSTWNTDGIVQFWYDSDSTVDSPTYSKTDMQWIVSGAPVGWNIVGLGGNSNNIHYTTPSTYSEQWYAIDDVVISTTAIGRDSSKILPPSNVTAD